MSPAAVSTPRLPARSACLPAHPVPGAAMRLDRQRGEPSDSAGRRGAERRGVPRFWTLLLLLALGCLRAAADGECGAGGVGWGPHRRGGSRHCPRGDAVSHRPLLLPPSRYFLPLFRTACPLPRGERGGPG